MIKKSIATAIAFVAFLAGHALCAVNHDDGPQPHCPEEDSCTVDYRDGAWHITEDSP